MGVTHQPGNPVIYQWALDFYLAELGMAGGYLGRRS